MFKKGDISKKSLEYFLFKATKFTFLKKNC